jgi:hypothetical protein
VLPDLAVVRAVIAASSRRGEVIVIASTCLECALTARFYGQVLSDSSPCASLQPLTTPSGILSS